MRKGVRGEELKPGFKRTTLTPIKGKRCVKVTSLIQTEAAPEDIYTVSIPALKRSQCIIPDTLVLSFKFTNSNTKSWFLNNLGRLLVDRLSVNVQGVEVYQNTGESMMEVYKDLWGSEEDQDRSLDSPTRTFESSRRKTTAVTSPPRRTESWISPSQRRVTG